MSTRWSEAEHEKLVALLPTRSHSEIANELGRTTHAIRQRAHQHGLVDTSDNWTAEQEAILRLAYADVGGPVDLTGVAARLGRHKTNVSRKARELGLGTSSGRRKSAAHAEAIRERSKANFGPSHPIWAHGKGECLSEETKAKIGAGSRRTWARLCQSPVKLEARNQKLSDALKGRPRTENAYSRGKQGKRADLAGRYFRSAWEANYARHLNALIARGEVRAWDYECRTFEFAHIKRGTRTYMPDFMVTFPDGRVEWHEVKGWMDPKSKTRIARFGRCFPEETLVIVGAAWFKAAERDGLAEQLPEWEWAKKRKRASS
jgi:hypothetical protein